MATEKAVGQNGLLYFWQNLKAKLAGKVDKVDGKSCAAPPWSTTLSWWSPARPSPRLC